MKKLFTLLTFLTALSCTLSSQSIITPPKGGGSGGGSGNVTGPGGGSAAHNLSCFADGTGLILEDCLIPSAKVLTTDGTQTIINKNIVASQLTGNLAAARFNSGTSADSSHYWRGDMTWATISGGGNVVGPGSSVANHVAGFADTTGQLLIDLGAFLSLPSLAQGDTIYASASNTPAALNKSTTAHSFFSNDGTSNNPVWELISESFLSLTDITTNNVSTSAHGFVKKLSGTATDFYNGAGNFLSVAESVITFTDITTNNSSTSKHGYLLKLDNNAAHYMDGTGSWSTPSGGGGGGITNLETGALTMTAPSAFSNVTGLTWSVTGGTPYHFHCSLQMATSFASTMVVAVNGPGSPTNLIYNEIAQYASLSSGFATTYDAAITGGNNTGGSFVELNGMVTPSTSGTFAIRAKVDSGNIVFNNGSFCSYW